MKARTQGSGHVLGGRPRLCDMRHERTLRSAAEARAAEMEGRVVSAQAHAEALRARLFTTTEERDLAHREMKTLITKANADRRLLLILVAMLDKLLLDGKAGEA